jgi:thioredoxin 1
LVAFDTPITTSDQSIDRVLKAGLPVLLVFLDGNTQASLSDTMRKLAQENQGKLLVVQVHAGENPESARHYQVTRTPAAVTVRDGAQLSKAEGVTASELERQAAYLLGKGPKPEPQAQPAAGAHAGGSREPIPVTDSTFEQQVMKSAKPVLVDFWAPWCGPCRMTNPIVEKLAREMPERLMVAKINVDQNPLVSSRYGIASIPTMMIVKNGRIVDRWAGAMPEANIRSRLQQYI